MQNSENTVDEYPVEYDNNVYLEFEKEIERRKIMDQLNRMYVKIFEKFKNGELVVYNPNIFAKLTREKFINWTINSGTL